MDQEIKMKLLEMLMEEMDDSVVSKLKKPEPMAVEVEMEAKEISPEEIKEKMMPEPKMESEDDEDYGDSRLMERLKALKKPKM